MKSQLTMPMVTGYEVFHWPEFQALMQRLGVKDITDATRNLSIKIELPSPDELVIVSVKHYAVDTTIVSAIEVTDNHNEDYRTYIPVPKREGQ